MRVFESFVCIDWSGEAVAHPKGLAAAIAHAGSAPPELLSPAGGWSRQAILDWLADHANQNTNMLVALDLSPALPFLDAGSYFPGWGESPGDAKSLWKFVDDQAASTPHLGASGLLSHIEARRHFRQFKDCGDRFPPGAGRFRVCEAYQRSMGLSPYSCFNLIGAAQVGKSSLTGMRVLHRLDGRIPIWPFDQLSDQGPVIVEIYTALAARQAGIRKGLSKIRDGAALDTALAHYDSAPHLPLARYTDHATDAILTAAWLRHVAAREDLWAPKGLTDEVARTEGWTFGVV